MSARESLVITSDVDVSIMDSAFSEIQALRRCTRDIVAVSTLPAIWASQAPVQIAGSLAEVLSDTLSLDLAYVRVNEPGGSPLEIGYTPQGFLTDERVGQVSRCIEPRLQSDLRIAVAQGVPHPLGPGTLQLAFISIGLAQRLGVLVVGAKRETFPLETERLVLNVAANQAAIVLERKWAELALESSQRQRAQLYEREQRRSQQLHRLARASLAINSAPSLSATLQLITESAREIIGCHQAFIRTTREPDRAESLSTGSLSAAPPPLRGRLATPLVGRNGRNIGLLQLSDRVEGEFTEDDEVILAQLAQTAAIAIENVGLYEEAKKERDLAESARAQLRLVSDTLPALVSYVDPSRTFRFVNAEYERWFGKPPHEILGKRLEELVGEENARLQAPYLEAALSGQQVGCELLTPHQDGRPRDTSLTYMPDLDPNGTVRGFVVLIQDISERKRVEAALKESAARLDLAVRTAQLGVFDWDITSDRHVWSDETARFFGYGPGEFPGTMEAFMGRVHPEDRDRLQDALQTAFKDRVEFQVEYRTRWPDGTTRWLSARGQVFFDAAGVPARLLGTLLDISEQKRVEQALREAVRTRDEFLSIASHELKTPITSLKMQLQMTQRKIKPEEQVGLPLEKLARVLAISTRQVDRLTNLVEDLLDVSRIQAGKLDFRFESVDLSSLVHEVVERLRDQLSEVRCSVEVFATDSLRVECDRFRVEQVVVNLLTNAMKYGAGRPIQISVEPLHHAARISVQDFGIGIDKDKHELIFERFARAVPSRNISGLGLGLYIVKQILNAHHGHVRVESEVGKGSTFVIELPLHQLTGPSMPVALHAVR
ncbi:ATP-binding protein [Hyalangium sp.]|uniref:sensor histidine kinase n=1 Tax=Hyalangium sp. TaxID=2028555 RepID=UPI002D3697F5|nr:ATP-binding protein [Hyalangium sp.]HYH97070.1 ATP-binding protein [Hyalangium sp.]